MPDCLEALEFHRMQLSAKINPNSVIGEATAASFLAKFVQPSQRLGKLAHTHPDNIDR